MGVGWLFLCMVCMSLLKPFLMKIVLSLPKEYSSINKNTNLYLNLLNTDKWARNCKSVAKPSIVKREKQFIPVTIDTVRGKRKCP